MAINNVTGNEKTDEWYTNPETVDKCIELLNPKPNSTICCPFDTAQSWFVIKLLKAGHNVIYGITDWLEEEYKYDYAITNPPFTIKDKVIEKAYKSGKPTVLVLPIDSLGGVKRHSMFRQYGYPTVFIPIKRTAYVDGTGGNRKSPSFHSVFMKFNDGEGIIWE